MHTITVTRPARRFVCSRVDRGALLGTAALLICGAAAIHLSGAPQQLARSVVLAVALALLGLAQLVAGLAVVAMPTRPLVRAVAGASALSVVIWGAAHSVGLPVGTSLWRPEALSIADLFLPTLELLAALLLVRVGWARQQRAPRPWLRGPGLLPGLLLAAVLTAAGMMDAINDAWFPVRATGPLSAVPGSTTTLAYCSPEGSPLAMDLSLPAAAASGPLPVVVNTRSAGWFYADRQTDGFAALLWPDGRDLNRALLAHGFAVATIDIRQAPLHPWPAQIEDATCAVRFLRAHAAELGIDPERIGAYGTSAGAHLAALLGTAGPAAGFDRGLGAPRRWLLRTIKKPLRRSRTMGAPFFVRRRQPRRPSTQSGETTPRHAGLRSTMPHSPTVNRSQDPELSCSRVRPWPPKPRTRAVAWMPSSAACASRASNRARMSRSTGDSPRDVPMASRRWPPRLWRAGPT